MATPTFASAAPAAVQGAALEALIRLHWESPFPVLLQDASFRVIDLNAACVAFLGYPRERVIGRDPMEFQPREDHAGTVAARRQVREELLRSDVAPMQERRLIDGQGRERWARVAGRVLRDEAGTLYYLSLLQDTTAEHVARERADRSARELDDWFVLSPVGMVLYDEAGTLVRTNPAFEALVGRLPVRLDEAPASLQHLLAWESAGPSDGSVRPGARRSGPALPPGGAPLVSQGWLALADGSQRHLRATVRCYHTSDGHRRYMAVIEDRSAEEERDLAQMQIGALMDTAGVGLATFQESSGWVRQRLRPVTDAVAGAPTPPPVSAALQSISRDIVLPESLDEYERLQHALRHAQRAEVRYAIRHPELGRRWLQTRVEPATLASGKRTTSVVTLDITEQQLSQARTRQLLRELSTILETGTAGIAYVRAGVLVRCNRRFEAMLGLRGVRVSGASLHELFGRHAEARRIIGDAMQALGAGKRYETEIELPDAAHPARPPKWYALAVRRSGAPGEQIEATAVLSDITRLKAQQAELEKLARDRALMFSLSEVGIAFVRDGRIEQANPALAQLTGRPVEALQALPLADLFADPASYERQWALEEAALRQHGRWVGERQLRRADGRLLWVQASVRLVREGDPAGGMIAAYVNVDDRHRAEQVVALQAERTRAILDSVLVGIVTVGQRGIEWMNRSARRMFGGDLGDFLNQPIGTVATPDPDHPFRQTHYLDELVEGEAETFECQVKARDGREFWVVGNVVATGREATGRQLTYALLDIERRRTAEQRMSQAQASLQRVIEAAPLAITLLDARTLEVLQINQVAARSVGRAPADLVGLTPEQIFPPEMGRQRRADMLEALRSRDVTQREYQVARAGRLDGDPVPTWDARYLPLATVPGQPPDQLLLVATDVTEQRAAQQAKFDAAITQREMLVKEVHHRIKNNLQGVAGLLQQIAQRKPEVAPAIAEVVGQVQAIAQVYGLQVGVTGPLRVKALVESITNSVQRTFGCQMQLEVRGPQPDAWALPEAESIPVALTINELLTNAVKHSAGLARVDCLLEVEDEVVRVVISNLGRLPDGFQLSRFPGGVSGLGLVRALLPRRSATFVLEQHGDAVRAVVTLVPPGVTRLMPL